MNNERSNRFKQRVLIEREVLLTVNSTLLRASSLNGLTTSAIDKWTRDAINCYGENKVTPLINIIKEISRFLKLQSDYSREIFEEALKINKVAVEELLYRFNNVLNDNFSTSVT